MGSKLIDKTTNYTRQAQGGVVTHEVEDDGRVTGARTTGAFPRGGLESRSGRDELMQEKAEMMDSMGMTKFGQVTATDADFEWLQKKRETAEFANLDAWIGKNFHTPDVATRKWLQETFPVSLFLSVKCEIARRLESALANTLLF